MRILVLNGSPKGMYSMTIHTAFYYEKRFPHHQYKFLHIAEKIKDYEKDFSEIKIAIKESDLIIFAHPVYTMLVPYQVVRFIELLQEHNVSLQDRYVAQITTSKHFFDTTAHDYMKEHFFDFGMKYLGGFSADMDDIQREEGRREADCFFEKIMFDIENNIFVQKKLPKPKISKSNYTPSFENIPKTKKEDVVIITNVASDDSVLQNMITDFINASSYPIRVINVRDFAFENGCKGCLCCTVKGTCDYEDGFDVFLKEKILVADVLLYAFSIKNHYTDSSMKCFDDRQFCNGHRVVTKGKITGYLISGDLEKEETLRHFIDARLSTNKMYSCGICTDQGDIKSDLEKMVKSLDFCVTNKLVTTQNFYGIGGALIFRDLVYLTQGLLVEDHKFFKQHGEYNFPQKQRMEILKMKLIGFILRRPSVQKKIGNDMSKYVIKTYQDIVANTVAKEIGKI